MRRGRPPYPGLLTPREQEVLALLQKGLTNEEIADRLGISRDGAKFHVSEILSKLGVQSRHQAAAWQSAGTGRFWGWGTLSAAAKKLSLEHVMKFTTGAVLAAAGAVVLLIALGILIMESRSSGEDEATAKSDDTVEEQPTPDVQPTVRTDPFGRLEFGWGDKVTYGIGGMDDVQIVADNTYRTIGDLSLDFDLYLPTDAAEGDSYPAVIIAPGIRLRSAGTHADTLALIHRDFKNKDEFSAYGRMVAASGLAAVIFDHRHEGFDLRVAKLEDLQAVVKDVREFIRYIRANGESFGIDPSRVCVWDGTAPFATVAAMEAPEGIRCMVMYYGPTDLSEVVGGVEAGELTSLQPSLSPEVWVPTFLVEGVGAQWSNEAFIAAAEESGVDFELHVSGYGLGFDYLCGADGGYHGGGDCFSESNRQQTAQIIQAALDFVSRHLQN